MADEFDAQGDPDSPMVYQIRIKGQWGQQWAAWFGGLTVTLTAHNETLLTGPVADQAALYGLLKKVRDLGAPLLSLNCLNPSPTDETEAADIRQ